MEKPKFDNKAKAELGAGCLVVIVMLAAGVGLGIWTANVFFK